MHYVGRPGIAPSLAVLLAREEFGRDAAILDVGCGNGQDAILLAEWGFRNVHAIDPDKAAIRAARMTATRRRLNRRVAFHVAGAETLPALYAPATFDLALHTLVANNLRKEHALHYRALASVMKKDALLVLTERVGTGWENLPPGKVTPPRGVRPYFALSPSISSHLAEHPALRRGPQYARVAIWLGRRR